MKSQTGALLGALLAALLVACGPTEEGTPAKVEPSKPQQDGPEKGVTKVAEPAPKPEPAPEPIVSAELAELDGHPGLAIGPALQAGVAERRQAVLEVLRGGNTAGKVPEFASDEGKAFDRRLVEKMTPAPTYVSVPKQAPVIVDMSIVSNGLDKLIVRRIIRAHLSELRHCHEVALKTKPDLAGKLVFGFVILPTGKVGEANALEDGLGSSVLSKCVTKAAARWSFPKPSNDAEVKVKQAIQFGL